jgi:hypothetical protein
MKRIVLFFIIILLNSFILLTCSNKSKDPKSLLSELEPQSLELFTLLNPYPSVKSSFYKLNPTTFNRKLNEGMTPISRDSIADSLNTTANLLLNDSSGLRESSLNLAKLLKRIRTYDESSYASAMGFMEKVRRSPANVITTVSPISNATLKEIYSTRSKTEVSNAIMDMALELQKKESIDLLKSFEDVMYKATYKNENTKSGLKQIMQGLTDESIIGDKTLKNQLVQIIGSVGDMMNKRSGFSNFTSANTVIKELLLNLEQFNTVGGSIYSSKADYTSTGYTNELSTLVTDLYPLIRKLLINDSNLVKDPSITVLDRLLTTLSTYETSDFELFDDTMLKLIGLDYLGRNRYETDLSKPNGDQITALESLMFILALTDIFGYEWDDTNPASPKVVGMIGESSGTSSQRNRGLLNGAITLGDSTSALKSLLKSDPGVIGLGMVKFLNDSKAAAGTVGFADGDVLRDGKNFPIGINTPALCLLQGEGMGDINASNQYASPCQDPIYTKTIPWVMGMLSRVIFEGYGPYYNRNKSSSYANRYKLSWKTSKFKIKVFYSNPQIVGYAGLDGTLIPNGDGTSYTIPEITKSDSERAVSSDEEAIYKNFMWLVHEKRFVLVIPVNAILSGGAKDATFVTVVANGLSGLMSAKPYCTNTGCVAQNNGKWNKFNEYIKTNNVIGDLDKFSSIPGDSVLLAQSFGGDLTGGSSYGFSTGMIPVLWDLLFTKANFPSEFYGAIPPVISQNFAIFERLGFLTDVNGTLGTTTTDSLKNTIKVIRPSDINISDTSSNSIWKKRNKLLPMVASLAKALKDSVDTTVGSEKNSFKILTDIARVLVRPYLSTSTVAKVYIGGVSNSCDQSITNPILTLRIASDLSDTSRKFLCTSESTPSENSATSDLRQKNRSNYWPDNSLRSLLSLLVEPYTSRFNNLRGAQDGVLSLLSQTKLISSTASMLNELSKAGRKAGRDKVVAGLIKILGEVKISSENPTSVQFNLQTTMQTITEDLKTYVRGRTSQTPSDPTWSKVDSVVQFLRDYFSTTSKYTLVRNIDGLLDILIDSKPTQAEAASLVEILAAVFTKEDGTQSYLLTTMLTEDMPKIIKVIAPDGRNFVVLLESLTRPGGFLGYMQDEMQTNASVTNLFIDLENLLKSDMLHTKAKNKTSLFYSTGILLKDFAKAIRFGKKLDKPGFQFADNFNETEAYDNRFYVLNYIFSVK